MNNPRLGLACWASATAIVLLVACKGGETAPSTTPSGGSGGTTSATGGMASGGTTTGAGGSGSGGVTSNGGSASGGSGGTTQGSGGTTQGSGGTTQGSGGTTQGSGGTTRTGGSSGPGGGSGGRTSSTAIGTGGIKATGGASGGKGGATGTDAGTAAAGLTIYYIRHAEVIANVVDPSEITIENADTLTDLGIRQIAALTTYLQGLGVTPDAILVSPHLRTQRTIGPYLVANNLPGEIWMELAEASSAAATGAPVPSEPKYIKFYKATIEVPSLVFRDPTHVEFWQNDNYESGLLMVMTSRDLLLERYGKSGKTIFVVGHAIAGQMLIGLLRGDNLLNGPTTTGSSAVYIYNTGVMKVVQDASTGLFKLEGRNMNNPTTK